MLPINHFSPPLGVVTFKIGRGDGGGETGAGLGGAGITGLGAGVAERVDGRTLTSFCNCAAA